MPTTQTTRPNGSFMDFYRGAYARDHATWPNRALHMIGTFGGLALLIASVTILHNGGRLPSRLSMSHPV
jgi:hypothetical protein